MAFLDGITTMQLLFCLPLILLYLHHSTAADIPEYGALLSIKSQITDDPQNALSSWTTESSQCTSWAHITCDSQGHVTTLNLTNLNLTGTLSANIVHLRLLTNLSLSFNIFTGPIPSSLPLSLIHLNLSNNFFNSSFPPQLSRLTNLHVLDLYNNSMTGDLPVAVTNMTNLRHLHMGGNFFTGRMPPEYGNWTHIQYLDVSSNSLTGQIPPELGKLATLIELSIGYLNTYEGNLPQEIANLTGIIRLKAASCGLTREIPKEIGYLKSLTLLDLSQNLLVGKIPNTFSKLKNLSTLILSYNKLNGQIPDFIIDLPQLEVLLLHVNDFTGRIPSGLDKIRKLQFLSFSANKLSGPITPEISRCKLLTYIDLSQNELSGEIPSEITSIRILNYLNLSKNHLSGSIPTAIFTMRSLKLVDFSFNNLSGFVSGIGQLSPFNSIVFRGNPNLCGPYLRPCKDGVTKGTLQPHAKGPIKISLKLLLIIGGSLISIAFVVATILKVGPLKKSSSASHSHEEPKPIEAPAWKLTAFQHLSFTCDDVLDSLKEDNIIGRGGAGIVYKGLMPNGDQIAVKKIPAMSRDSSHDQGFTEILTLGRITYIHIVTLLGFCSNNETILLIYKYMCNGSLGRFLHGVEGGQLSWDTRYKIAVQAARGLCYLHHKCSPRILHRDVKSNNILLDRDFAAYVADFGLAKFLQDSSTSNYASIIVGTFGYIAPEYLETSKVDEKSDVYSFGVVLLELVTGRKALGDFGDCLSLVQWVQHISNSNVEEIKKILDPRPPSISFHKAIYLFYIAVMCVEKEAIKRPTMEEVVNSLTGSGFEL